MSQAYPSKLLAIVIIYTQMRLIRNHGEFFLYGD